MAVGEWMKGDGGSVPGVQAGAALDREPEYWPRNRFFCRLGVSPITARSGDPFLPAMLWKRLFVIYNSNF